MNCLSANKCNCLDRVAEARVRRREAEEAKRRTVADFHWAVVEAIAFLGGVVMFGGLTSTSIRAEGIFQDGLNSSIQGSLDQVLGAIGLHLDWSRSNPTVTN